MDSFEVNKILGAVLGTLTLTLGLSIASEMVFDPGMPEKAGYPIEVPEDTGGGAVADSGVEPIAVRLAKADPARGEALTRQCASCHSFEQGGANKVGPNLYGIVGNHHAHLDGFNYSAAMKEKASEPWTFEAMDEFLDNPRSALPGTIMAYAGLKRPDQRADLIAYLNQNSANPQPLPEVPAEPAAEEGAEAPAEGAAPAQDAQKPAEDGKAPAAQPSEEPKATEPGQKAEEPESTNPVPQPQTEPSGEQPTPPSGAAEGGTPEQPQGGAGNEAPVQAPATGDSQRVE